MFSSPSSREMTILDSWTHTGATSPTEHASIGQDETSRTLAVSFFRLVLTQCSTGSFKLHWDVVCNIFDGVYVSWDPGIFEHQLMYHGTWTAGSMSLQNEDIHCMGGGPGSIYGS